MGRLGASLRRAASFAASPRKRIGASIDWVYRGGNYQHHFKVYQRAGEACPRCGTKIKRITVGQRGTHFCPRCQKKL